MPYMPYPLVMTNIAIENDHRNSGFPINNGDGKFPGELAHWPQMAPGHYWGCKFGTPESEDVKPQCLKSYQDHFNQADQGMGPMASGHLYGGRACPLLPPIDM